VGGRVAVEAIADDDRATFVFAGLDPVAVNVLLLQTAFRREAVALPEAELGRWAVAARTSAPVRRARAALVARVVHGPGWAEAVTAALTGG